MTGLLRCIVLLTATGAVWAGDWSDPVTATARDGTALVTCRARLANQYLVVEVTPAEGWHVYAMDNESRAREALAGKTSLGVEENTELSVSGGLEQVGDWFQSVPQDFSQPELRWFSYGFGKTAVFASRVRRTDGPSAKVAVRAQACDSTTCMLVEAELELPLDDPEREGFTTEGLVRVSGS